MKFRIEAACVENVPVSFRVVPDKVPTAPSYEAAATRAAITADDVISVVLLVGVVAAVYMAFQNIRTNRSDRRGAFSNT